MGTLNNSADDITRGKSLLELVEKGRKGHHFKVWNTGENNQRESAVGSSELKGITFCCLKVVQSNDSIPDASKFSTWKELMTATQQACQGAKGTALDSTHSQTISPREAELLLLRNQTPSFSAEVTAIAETRASLQ